MNVSSRGPFGQTASLLTLLPGKWRTRQQVVGLIPERFQRRSTGWPSLEALRKARTSGQWTRARTVAYLLIEIDGWLGRSPASRDCQRQIPSETRQVPDFLGPSSAGTRVS